MFAFGIPGRLTVTGYTDADRDQIEAQMGKTIADLKVEVNAFFEYWLLATPRSLRDEIPGFEPVSTREDAEAELRRDQGHGRQPAQRQGDHHRPMDAISARRYGATLRQLQARHAQRRVHDQLAVPRQGGANQLP